MNQQVRTCSCCTRSPNRPPVVLRLAEVMAITKLSKPTIYRRMKAGTFPPSKTAGGLAYWLAEDVDRWVFENITSQFDQYNVSGLV